MKKIVIAMALMLSSTLLWSQKSAIQSTIQSLKDNDIAKAKEQIDQAVVNEATSGNAKAWLLKGVIYQAIGTNKEDMPLMNFNLNGNDYVLGLAGAADLHSSIPDALFTATEAYNKSMSLDSKYSKEELVPLISNLAFTHYNNAINFMNAGKFNDAAKSFEATCKVAGLDKGNFYKGVAQVDTLAATSRYYQGYSLYQAGDEKAVEILEEAGNSPFVSSADLYMMLLELYERKGDDAKWNATIKAARTKFPKDAKLLDQEINYSIKMNKAEEAIAKLKEGIAANPGKLDLYILLGQTYYKMANPEKGSKPANAKELEKSALENFSKVMEKEPNNVYGQFFTGLIYFNQGKEVNDIMVKADDKKYAEMKPQRDELINKSLPYLEKARSLSEAEGIKDENRDNYRSALYGLMQCYSLLGKTEKSEEAKKKYESVR
jgi:tetratricopeptide (TPR) repeat protein